jgi:predicted PurR-regulated permease PerM
VLGVLYSLGLMIVGIDLAVVIGMAAGALFIVPYLGTVIGVVAASVMAILKFGIGWQLVGVWAVFAIVQLFEGTLLTPKIMGDKVGLSPVVVIFALLVGSDLLGILGMLMAVPAAAVIKVFIDEGIDRYRNSEFFLENDSVETNPDPPD